MEYYKYNNFELQQDLNSYQNKNGDKELRNLETDELYKLKLKTIVDLDNLKKYRAEIMFTDHNEEFISLNNDYNYYYFYIILIIIIIMFF